MERQNPARGGSYDIVERVKERRESTERRGKDGKSRRVAVYFGGKEKTTGGSEEIL